MKTRMKTRGSGELLPWVCFMVGMYFSVAFLFIFWGGFVNDEAYYALSARNVLTGMKPYRDYLYPQMPLLSYVYAGWFLITGPSIEAARVLSAIFGGASVAIISLACHRRAGKLAGIVGGLLVALSWHVVCDTTTVKTQALTVFLTSCSIFVLAKRDSSKPVLQMGMAMLFMTLALFQRLSILPALVFLWMFLGWRSRQSIRPFIILLAINLLLIAALFAHFYSDGNMLFGIYRVHNEYWATWAWSWSTLFITIRSWIGNQLPIILFFFSAIGLFIAESIQKKRFMALSDDFLFCCFLLLSYWAYTILHWRSVQNYATHHTCVVPFAVVFSMTVLAPKLNALAEDGRAFWGFALALLLCLPLPFGEQRGLPAFDGNGASEKIREVLSIIRPYAHRGDSLLGFNAELAVNGGYSVLPGYEMREYSYFPTMTDEQCAKYQVISTRRLNEDIASAKSPVLCVGDYEFSIMSRRNEQSANQLRELIDKHYRQVGFVRNYGQFSENYYVYARKP